MNTFDKLTNLAYSLNTCGNPEWAAAVQEAVRLCEAT